MCMVSSRLSGITINMGIKMSKAILGIDVSKKELVVALFMCDSSIHKKKFSNDKAGFNSLLNWLRIKKVNDIKACMEATGNYSTAIADFLYNLGYEVSVINPACVKAFASSKLTRSKTDELDSVIIAQYASKSELLPCKPIDPNLKELRYLYRCLNDLKDQHVQVLNYLENEDLLPSAVCKVWKELSQNLQQQMSNIEKSIDILLENNSSINQQSQNLQTIPGIGKTTAVAIIAESPDISIFKDARSYAAYAGLVPKHRTSGSSIKGKARLSKLGSAKLRKAVYFPAIVAKNHNPILKSFAEKLKKKGKHTMVIIGAVMRKLLHIVFAVLKYNTAFNPNLYSVNFNNEVAYEKSILTC